MRDSDNYPASVQEFLESSEYQVRWTRDVFLSRFADFLARSKIPRARKKSS